MLGQLSNIEIEEVLQSQNIGRIGCHANDLTYIVPVSYAYNSSIVYSFSKDGLKIELMRYNPEVCFEVEGIESLGKWQTVIAWGRFKELTIQRERKNALKLLLNRRLPLITSENTMISPEWPFEPEDYNQIQGIVYSITLYRKSGRFENLEGSFHSY